MTVLRISLDYLASLNHEAVVLFSQTSKRWLSPFDIYTTVAAFFCLPAQEFYQEANFVKESALALRAARMAEMVVRPFSVR